MSVRLLIVAAVEKEAASWGDLGPDVRTIVGGVGRVSAACATTEALIEHPTIDAVLSAGVAGALPGSGLDLRDVVVASADVYVEEGLVTPDGFSDMRGLGFPLGPFEGNVVPADAGLHDAWVEAAVGRSGRMATVATCSGTDASAAVVVERTGGLAEAMEGAAVLHAALRRGVGAGEIRAISNTTGDRDRQRWDLAGGLDRLGEAVRAACEAWRTRSGNNGG